MEVFKCVSCVEISDLCRLFWYLNWTGHDCYGLNNPKSAILNRTTRQTLQCVCVCVRLTKLNSTCDDGTMEVCFQELLLHKLWTAAKTQHEPESTVKVNKDLKRAVGWGSRLESSKMIYHVGFSPPHRSVMYCLQSSCRGRKSWYLHRE